MNGYTKKSSKAAAELSAGPSIQSLGANGQADFFLKFAVLDFI